MNELLNAILDTLIPPSRDGRMPGAGSLGLSDAIQAQVDGDLLAAGLAEAETGNFLGLDLDSRVAFLKQLESSQPALIPSLYFPTCAAYYQHPKVQVGLGLEARPPHPKGYALEAGDLAGLERVRARGKLYRDA